MSPDGTTLYVAEGGLAELQPIALPADALGAPISVGAGPNGVAVSPDGSTVWVTSGGSGPCPAITPAETLTAIATSTGTAVAPGPIAMTGPVGPAITPDGSTLYVPQGAAGASTDVVPVSMTSQNGQPLIEAGTAFNGGEWPFQVVIAPDQAPVASFSAQTAPAGQPSTFDASASTTSVGAIATYHWDFGDGSQASTQTPTTTHTYVIAGTHTVTLTVSDTAGTSNTRVFTGQQVIRNGGSSAQTAHALTVPPARSSGPPTPARTCPVTSTRNAGPGSLREAMLLANAGGCGTITFAIPGSGVKTIRPLSALPQVTRPIAIDGTTQPGFNGTPLIRLDGSALLLTVPGLVLSSGGSIVSGIEMTGWEVGIQLRQPGGDVIAGDFVGTDGKTAQPNGYAGVEITAGSSHNMIGGNSPGDRNVISGNGNFGVLITGSGAAGNLVEGDYVGTDAAGTARIPNVVGVGIDRGAAANTVTTRNVISGNQYGVVIAYGGTTRNVVTGDYIGTTADGTAALGNTHDGVIIALGATTNTIAGNVISSNLGGGVTIWSAGSSGNTVTGNLIGTNATGTAALHNGIGVAVGYAAGNTVGGPTAALRNVISGNSLYGLLMTFNGANANTVEGNYVGTDVTGTTAIPDGVGVAIVFGPRDNTVGGPAAGAGNVISGNAGPGPLNGRGVEILGSGTSDNKIAGNYIGVDATGEQPIPNNNTGVIVNQGATNNTIGGTVPGSRNVVSGNGSFGIMINDPGTSGNVVAGNYVGTDANGVARTLADSDLGDAGLGQYYAGIMVGIGATSNMIGGTVAGARNVIAGTALAGVALTLGTRGNLVEGNYIGTDADGTIEPNAFEANGVGVLIGSGATDNTIGGIDVRARNVISDSLGSFGISIPGTGVLPGVGVGITGAGTARNLVEGNDIGTDASGAGTDPTGVFSLGNFDAGVQVDSGADDDTIGGPQAGAGNTIAYNGLGVRIYGPSARNSLLGNSIFNSSGGTGILQISGGNGNEPPPVIKSIMQVALAGRDATAVSGNDRRGRRIELFANPGCTDPEGMTYLGAPIAGVPTSSATGSWMFDVPLLPAGTGVTATATDIATGSTSEFSTCVLAADPSAGSINRTEARWAASAFSRSSPGRNPRMHVSAPLWRISLVLQHDARRLAQPPARNVAEMTARFGVAAGGSLQASLGKATSVCIVPRVVGKTLTAARRALAKGRCRAGRITRRSSARASRGRVVAQQPTAGTRRPPRTRVNVVVGA